MPSSAPDTWVLRIRGKIADMETHYFTIPGKVIHGLSRRDT